MNNDLTGVVCRCSWRVLIMVGGGTEIELLKENIEILFMHSTSLHCSDDYESHMQDGNREGGCTWSICV